MTQPTHPLMAPGRKTSERLEWVDSARAACVIAVVAYHFYIWHFATVEVPSGSVAGAAWEQINRLLGALRMPFLLVLSGMLAANKVRNGFSERKATQFTISNYYLYVVWLVIYALAGWFLGSNTTKGHLDGSIPVALQLLIPDTTLWFIYALAVYVPALILVRQAPPILILGGLAVVNIGVALMVNGTEPLWLKVVRLAVYFAIGVYGKDLIFRLASTKKYAMAGVGLVAAATLTAVSFLSIPDALNESLYLLRSLAFVAALIGITAVLMQFRWLSRVGRMVGAKTLPIYVIHPLLIVGLSDLAEGPLQGVLSIVASNTAVALAYPAVVTVLIVIACVLVERALIACGLRALFRAPGWLLR